MSHSSLVQLLPLALELSDSPSDSSSCSNTGSAGFISTIGLTDALPESLSELLLSVLQRLLRPGRLGGKRARGVDPDPEPNRPFVNPWGVFAPPPAGPLAAFPAEPDAPAELGETGGKRVKDDRSSVPGDTRDFFAERVNEGDAEPDGVRGVLSDEGPASAPLVFIDDGKGESAELRRR